jgi:glycosyltransferase involved in cell wall biosynthesis
MSFVKRQLKPWTFLWFMQRIIVVLKEFRLPQIDFKSELESFNVRRKQTAEIKERINDYKNKTRNQSFRPLHIKTESEGEFSLYPIIIKESLRDQHLINFYFDKIFVVNLKSRSDRRLQMVQRLVQLGIRADIFFADNGYSKENVNEFLHYYQQPVGGEDAHRFEIFFKKKAIQSPGAWGYLKTYKRLLQYAMDQGFKRILCLDDDIIEHEQFHLLFESRIKDIPQDWKLLYLGATQHSWTSIETDENNINLVDKFSGSSPYYHPKYTDGSFAIGIDHSVFQLLLDEIERMNCSFDTGALREVNFTFPDKTFVMLPNLVIADVSDSDIGTKRDQKDFAMKMRWNLELYNNSLQYELVSVIMPAYNAEKTIENSIRSILNQTYPNLELIIVDDGSDDDTPLIAGNIARVDKRVRFYRLDRNMGCYVARNEGIRHSKGKYIAIQDADDIALKDRLEKQLLPLCAGHAEFTVAHVFRSRCQPEELSFDNQAEMVRLVLSRRKKTSSGEYAYRDVPILGLMTTVFNRSIFEELGLYWENRFGADAEFLERALFYRKGIRLKEIEMTTQFYLSGIDKIDGLYKRINEVLVVSPDMNGQNITGSYTHEERDAFLSTWRQQYDGHKTYQYPRIEP